jgi:hypothetical protein
MLEEDALYEYYRLKKSYFIFGFLDFSFGRIVLNGCDLNAQQGKEVKP